MTNSRTAAIANISSPITIWWFDTNHTEWRFIFRNISNSFSEWKNFFFIIIESPIDIAEFMCARCSIYSSVQIRLWFGHKQEKKYIYVYRTHRSVWQVCERIYLLQVVALLSMNTSAKYTNSKQMWKHRWWAKPNVIPGNIKIWLKRMYVSDQLDEKVSTFTHAQQRKLIPLTGSM